MPGRHAPSLRGPADHNQIVPDRRSGGPTRLPLALGLGLGAVLSLGGCGLPEHNNVAIAAGPDGRLVVFADSDGVLHRLDLDTNEVTPITTDLRPARQPAVSSDGKDVVYAAAAPGEEGTSLYIQPLAGGAPATWLTRDGSGPRRIGTRKFTRVDRLCFAEGGTQLILGGSPDPAALSPGLYRGPADGPGEFEPFAVPDHVDGEGGRGGPWGASRRPPPTAS